ncbi:hypothetical protein KAT08_01805 [Candidatus Babeliales bacterium]|nr:hypothetical protein [Candidatus Babeliales bacterium]
MTLSLNNKKKFLIFLFCLSFLIRAIIFGFFLSKNKNYWNRDSKAYNNVAIQISKGKGIVNLDSSYHFHRVPAYSMFLALCYKCFGYDIKKALWIQIFFASFIPILIFYLSLFLFNNNIFLAKICSIFTSFHIGYVLFSGLVMTEVFFILFFSIFLILFLRNFNFFFCQKKYIKNSYKFFLISGIFLGLASLMRPVGHYIVFISLGFLLLSDFNFIKKIKSIILLFIGWLMIVFWWLLRNYLLTGFIFFHTLSGIHFLKHSAGRLVMKSHDCSYMQALDRLNNEINIFQGKKEKDIGRKLNEIEYCQLAEKVSFKYLKKDYVLTTKHFLTNIFKTCFSLYSAMLLHINSGGKLPDYNKNRGWKKVLKRFLFPDTLSRWLKFVIYLEIFFHLFIWIGFLGFSTYSFFCKDYLCVFLKTFPFIFLFIFISLACGFARLRLPIECFLIILSFKFWLDLFWRRKSGLWIKV